jgi:hypothetical protein
MWSLKKVNINIVVFQKKSCFSLMALDLFLSAFSLKNLAESMMNVLKGNVLPFRQTALLRRFELNALSPTLCTPAPLFLFRQSMCHTFIVPVSI